MDLPSDLKMPQMFKIRQRLEVPRVDDVAGTVRAELKRIGIEQLIKPGQRIAITAGSRGIVNIATIIKAIADEVKAQGAEPFIVPTMGSHGGATPEGQKEVLRNIGITEASVGAPILSSLEVVQIGKTADGVPVYLDKYASQADGIIVAARVKPHTDFEGPIESGLHKMMVIGLGKHKGALAMHRGAMTRGFQHTIPSVARVVLKEAPIICGLVTVENAYDQTAKIEAVKRDEFEAREMELLALAKRLIARLPFQEMHVLLVDEQGKDITGAGMDPNVIGRIQNKASDEPEFPKITRVIIRDLTEATHGNATGMGKADFTTRRLFEKIDYNSTYINCITGGAPEGARIPMVCENDKQALVYAMTTIGDKDDKTIKLMWIKNTLELEEMYVSEAFLPEVQAREDLQVLEGPVPMEFAADNYLVDKFSRRKVGSH
ncbi:MAG: nickel pincer cofactor-dependent isomerase, group 22 [Chloroflexota bacterium]